MNWLGTSGLEHSNRATKKSHSIEGNQGLAFPPSNKKLPRQAHHFRGWNKCTIHNPRRALQQQQRRCSRRSANTKKEAARGKIITPALFPFYNKYSLYLISLLPLSLKSKFDLLFSQLIPLSHCFHCCALNMPGKL